MQFTFDDGGRKEAGFTGTAGDCVVRSIAIATGKPYREVYDELFALNRKSNRKGNNSPRDGGTAKKTVRKYMESLGWKWTPTMAIGSGCKVHLADGELPSGRLVVSVSRHQVAVIDGVIHDTYDPQRETICFEPDTGRDLKPGEDRNNNGIFRISRRCVYGYFSQT